MQKMMQTVFRLEPITGKAKDWIEENVRYESYQMLGNSVIVEHRYIADIVAGMREAGLVINKDFSVD